MEAYILKLQDSDNSSSDSSSEEEEDDEEEEEMEPSPVCFVLDYGAGIIKLGLTQDENGKSIFSPSGCFPSLTNESLPRAEDDACWAHTIESWKFLFAEEKIDPSQYGAIVAVDPLATEYTKKKIQEIMFDTFNVQTCHVESTGVLVAYSYGALSGLVVDLGDYAARIIPIYCGSVLTAAVLEIGSLGTHTMVEALAKLLTEEHKDVFGRSTADEVHAMARGLLMGSQEQILIRPSGAQVKFDASPEVALVRKLYVDPKVALSNPASKLKLLAEYILDSVNACDMDVRSELFSHILLSGGGALVENLAEDLTESLQDVAPHAADNIEITFDPTSALHAAWSGGSVMTTLEGYEHSPYVVSQFSYQERKEQEEEKALAAQVQAVAAAGRPVDSDED
jgi:hypothetical protein